MLNYLGKVLVGIGIFIVILGIILLVIHKLNFQLGRLPLDIYIRKKNFVFYFPLGLSLIASILLTIFLSFFQRK